jgi:CheY-like chemotaxis protein
MKYAEATILIVEDNKDDALLIQRALRRARLINPLRLVANGEQAIQYLRGDGQYADRLSHPLPELVLLDLQMPGVSGLEVLKWIRDRTEFRQLAVVILTSSDQAPDARRAYELGANSYLIKPVGFEELDQMAKRLGAFWLLVNEPASEDATA